MSLQLFKALGTRFTAILGGLLFAFALPFAHAQSGKWKPEKSIELVAPSGVGGGLDRTARSMQRIIQERKLVEVPVAVVNKAGAGNAIGYTYVNQQQGDGHYILVTAPNIVTNRITGVNPIDYTDMTPIAMLFSEFVAFTVKRDSDIKDGKDLLDRLKKDPASVSFGVAPSLGGSNHLAPAMVLKAAGVDIKKIKFVVFPGSGDSAVAAMGGHVDVNASSSALVISPVTAGKMKIVGVTAPTRMAGVFNTAPTWKEQGINAVWGTWRVVLGPRGMSAAQIEYWESVIARLVKTDEWKGDLDKNLWVDIYMNSKDTKAFLDAQRTDLRALLAELGLAKQ